MEVRGDSVQFGQWQCSPHAREAREAVEAIESGIIDPRKLITHRYPLERLDEALNATRERPGNFVKAVVVP